MRVLIAVAMLAVAGCGGEEVVGTEDALSVGDGACIWFPSGECNPDRSPDDCLSVADYLDCGAGILCPDECTVKPCVSDDDCGDGACEMVLDGVTGICS